MSTSVNSGCNPYFLIFCPRWSFCTLEWQQIRVFFSIFSGISIFSGMFHKNSLNFRLEQLLTSLVISTGEFCEAKWISNPNSLSANRTVYWVFLHVKVTTAFPVCSKLAYLFVNVSTSLLPESLYFLHCSRRYLSYFITSCGTVRITLMTLHMTTRTSTKRFMRMILLLWWVQTRSYQQMANLLRLLPSSGKGAADFVVFLTFVQNWKVAISGCDNFVLDNLTLLTCAEVTNMKMVYFVTFVVT